MTFLFDIGRVLLDFDFDFETSIQRLIPPGISDGSERMKQFIERKDDFEAGKIEAADYIEWTLGVLESPATPEEFIEAWRRIFTPNEPMWNCVRQLAAAGHRLILFSNTNIIHCPWIFTEYPEFSHFPEAVLSFDTGFVKPEHGIYQYAIDTYSLIPSETLYIDDMEANIITGREFGFRSWQYDLNDHAAFEQWLAANLQSEI